MTRKKPRRANGERNPFRIHGTVTADDFADRETEVRRISRAFRDAGSKLLVYGPRRMGKTSAMREAARRVEASGGHVVLADLSTASTPVDIGNRILDGAARALGRRWRDVVRDLVERVGVTLSLTADPATGLILPSLDVGLRRGGAGEQLVTLGRVLDAIESLARDRGATIGLGLDEFQEIHRFGGEDAEWHLRGVIQNHESVAYVLAGSETHLIERMLGRGRAFYGLVDVLPLGAMGGDTLASWIDERLEAAGVASSGAGATCVRVAGPRTRDVVRLARKMFDIAAASRESGATAVEAAYLELVEEEDELIRSFWESLTPLQQNVLRAVAASTTGLTTTRTMERFGLATSGGVANAAKALVDAGHLVRVESGSGYAFDTPFVRGWMIVHALPDLGIRLEATFRADEDGDERA